MKKIIIGYLKDYLIFSPCPGDKKTIGHLKLMNLTDTGALELYQWARMRMKQFGRPTITIDGIVYTNTEYSIIAMSNNSGRTNLETLINQLDGRHRFNTRRDLMDF